MKRSRGKKKKLLVVENDKEVRQLLSRGFSKKGFAVESVSDGKSALDKAYGNRDKYTVYVIDSRTPKLEGIKLLKKLRATGDDTPALFLGSVDDVKERVAALDAGADDYVMKPFDFSELSARVRALVRRAPPERETTVEIGDLYVDRVEREVIYKNRRVELTPREYELLDFLLKNRGKEVTRDEISRAVWRFPYTGESNFVDVYIRHLRFKIWKKAKSQIKTVRGSGYKFELEPESAKSKGAEA